MKNVVLCYSGGLDSTVLLYWLRNQGINVRCLAVNYGQKHKKELDAGMMTALNLGVHLEVIDFTHTRLPNLIATSSQTSANIEVPEGHYEEESMKLTVVPNRNMLLLALAGSWAVATKSDAVAYAAHSGDHAIYPDCRPEFTEVMDKALRMCDWHEVKLIRPFLSPRGMSKADIVKLGSDLGVPFAETWSCYKGGAKHCGKCGTCVERREAFQVARVTDPTEYE